MSSPSFVHQLYGATSEEISDQLLEGLETVSSAIRNIGNGTGGADRAERLAELFDGLRKHSLRLRQALIAESRNSDPSAA